MKKLLLLAKYIAVENNEKTISIENIEKVYFTYRVVNQLISKDIFTTICEVQSKKIPEKIPPGGKKFTNQKMIEKALKNTDISIDKSVKKFISYMKNKGYSTTCEDIDFVGLNQARNKKIAAAKAYKNNQNVKEIVQENLQKTIKGQLLAVETISKALSRANKPQKGKPFLSFMFLGPPAVGKTQMAKAIANYLKDYNYLEVNMSHYTGHQDGGKLFGIEKGFNTESNGLLTSTVKKFPKTILFFDEFEKAHTVIQQRLLSIYSEGLLDDALGWINGSSVNSEKTKGIGGITSQVDFSQAIIILASNLGSNIYNNDIFIEDIKNNYYETENLILQELQKEKKLQESMLVPAIIPELLSRLSSSKIILFEKLSFQNIRDIVLSEFDERLRNFNNSMPFKLEFIYNHYFLLATDLLILTFSPFIDIRRLKDKIFDKIIDPIESYMELHNLLWTDITKVEVVLEQKVINLIKDEFENRDKLMKDLFRQNKTLKLEYDLSLDSRFKKLIFKITTAKLEKVKKISDFSDSAGALLFDIPDTSFDDIFGHTKIKERLLSITQLMKKTNLIEEKNVRVPKGMLLYGKAGTGKTALARAISNETKLPFIQTTANEMINLKSNSMDTMKKIFQRAREYAPSIIFIDEIDTFGSRENGNNSFIINELLTQIDGFVKDNNVFIIGATNYKNKIDPALLRAGRLELHIEVPVLDKEARIAFLEKIIDKYSQKTEFDIEKLATQTSGLTGAQIDKIGNEAFLYCLKKGIHNVTQDILLEQINIEKYGDRINNEIIDKMVEQTAYHEAGHAVISKILSPETPIEQISVTARKNSLGFVAYNQDKAILQYTRSELISNILIAYAGRVSQIKKFGESGIDTGSSSDIEKATSIAYNMVTQYGMDIEIKMVNTAIINELPENAIFNRVLNILHDCEKQTIKLVDKYWNVIESVALYIIEYETITEKELMDILIQN